MLLFRSEGHISTWQGRTQGIIGATMTLQQQWQLARTWYADRLSPDWRRYSPEEAQDIFERVGLTDRFWRIA